MCSLAFLHYDKKPDELKEPEGGRSRVSWRHYFRAHGKTVLIPPGKHKITTIFFFEADLKKALLNIGQDNRHWTGPYLEFPEDGHKLC